MSLNASLGSKFRSSSGASLLSPEQILASRTLASKQGVSNPIPNEHFEEAADDRWHTHLLCTSRHAMNRTEYLGHNAVYTSLQKGRERLLEYRRSGQMTESTFPNLLRWAMKDRIGENKSGVNARFSWVLLRRGLR